jgi:triacylglycerol lipase
MTKIGVLLALLLSVSLVGGLSACQTAPEVTKASSGWPVILVHGFGGSTDYPIVGDYFHGVRDVLAADGVEVLAPSLPRFASSKERARALAAVVDKALVASGKERVHLIAHSQGGLDSRYLIEHLGYDTKVGSLTTLSTPHEGTPVAMIWEPFPDPLVDVALSVPALKSTDGSGAVDTLSGGEWSPARERAYPVPAFSFAGLAGTDLQGACEGGLWGKPSHVAAPQTWLLGQWSMINASRPGVVRANDGLVPVDSARWQRFLGCLPADHVALIGLGGFAFEAEEAAFRPGPFLRDYIRTLRVLEQGGSADDVVYNPPPSLGRLMR